MKGIKVLLALLAAVIVLATTVLLVQQGRAEGVQPTIDVHRPFLYMDERSAEAFGPACADCHELSIGYYDPQNFLPSSESVALGATEESRSPASPGAQYSPIYANDTLVGLWVSGHIGMKDLPIRFSTLQEKP